MKRKKEKNPLGIGLRSY